MKMFKDWFMNKFSQNERYAMSVADEVIRVRETEKAVLFKFEGEWAMQVWAPKSALYTAEELAAEAEKMSVVRDRYTALVDFGKANGLNFRTGLKVATMLAKVRAAGLEYAY